jgi:hypothetical protein
MRQGNDGGEDSIDGLLERGHSAALSHARYRRHEPSPPFAFTRPRPSLRPVIALNAAEGWSRDVSETIAAKVRDVAEHEDLDLTSGTIAFIEMHIERVLQPTLPLW